MSSLYPIDSESREAKDLSGVWDFIIDPDDRGIDRGWHLSPLKGATAMPVPASYNDISTDPAVRDHVGDVWYQREFFVPASWGDSRLAVRFGSVTHHAEVWLNGRRVAEHRGGFLPFEADISDVAIIGASNRLTVRVNNILDWTTLPPGELTYKNDPANPSGKTRRQTYHFDFFNFAGIHRPVYLTRTPKYFIRDISVTTEINGRDGIVRYETDLHGNPDRITAVLHDAEGQVVAEATGPSGGLVVHGAKLWKPGNAYLYRLEVSASFTGGQPDVYRLPVGIRTVRIEGGKFLINDKPFYFRGFGKHEDADLRGRGLDHATNVRDFNLMKWIGANSFRTSHYPYSEEIMQMADREGIVVIDEAPAVGMNFFGGDQAGEKIFCEQRVNDKTLAHHLQVMRDLIERDRNHPSVVMWSVANEASTGEDAAVPYFTAVAEETRKCDPTRPISIVTFRPARSAKVEHLFDVIGVNRYKGWYENPGDLGSIQRDIEHDLRELHEVFGKPILVTEFGADTIAGFHQQPPAMFSEEYQSELISLTASVFDRLDFLIGEHVWNFADFATKQGPNRVLGNRKGVFTRQRQPKMAAHTLRLRWNNARK